MLRRRRSRDVRSGGQLEARREAYEPGERGWIKKKNRTGQIPTRSGSGNVRAAKRRL